MHIADQIYIVDLVSSIHCCIIINILIFICLSICESELKLFFFFIAGLRRYISSSSMTQLAMALAKSKVSGTAKLDRIVDLRAAAW